MHFSSAEYHVSIQVEKDLLVLLLLIPLKARENYIYPACFLVLKRLQEIRSLALPMFPMLTTVSKVVHEHNVRASSFMSK